MCVTPFVVEDTQVIKIQTFPATSKAHSCENILLYGTYQLTAFRKKKKYSFVTFSHPMLQFPQRQEGAP